MNEQALIDSFELFQQEGYNGTIDDFKMLMANNDKALNDMFGLFVDQGYRKSKEDYSVLIGAKPPKTVKKKDITESTLVDGSLEQFNIEDYTKKEKPNFREDPRVQISESTRVSEKQPLIQSPISQGEPDQGEAVDVQQVLADINAETRTTEEIRQQEMDAFLKQEKLDQETALEQSKINQTLLTQSEDFQTDLSTINADLIGQEEEDVIPLLKQKFQKYGFSFEKSGIGDGVLVTNFDGSQTIDINLDPYTTKTEILESQNLKNFLSQHALEEFETNELLDFEGQSAKAQDLRRVGRINPDGTTSTVLMTSYEADGKHYAIPTLFPKNPEFYGTNPNDWMNLDFDEAKKVAEERGEVFQFDTEEEAQRFAEGEWKDTHSTDAVGKSIYSEVGLNFKSEKAKYDEYLKVRDEIDFIEGEMGITISGQDLKAKGLERRLDELSEEEQKKFGSFYVNGQLRDDFREVIKELSQKENDLYNEVNTEELMSLREKYDLTLQKKYSAIAKDASRANYEAMAFEDALQVQSLQNFGVRLEDLTDIEPKTELEEQILDNFKIQKASLNAEKQHAANIYESAKTFYSSKYDKTIMDEFETGNAAVYSELRKGLNDGNASEIILQLSTGMAFDFQSLDLDNEEDRKKAAEMIVALKTKNRGKKDSKALSRWNRAKGFRESFDAFIRNPSETALAFAANSIGMMLPYGAEIVTATTITGAGIGGALGAGGFVTGPGGVLTTTGGAIAGAGKGFKGGMALTALAMEYTNEYFAAMEAEGYDVLNAKDVELAMQDEDVWATAKERGLKRGIPIALVDYLTAGLAGRVFKVGKVATRTKKIVSQVGERFVFDPIGEMAGEAAAQISVGDELDFKEIAAEGIGGFGNNSSMMVINKFIDGRNNSNIELASKLTDINFIVNEKESDTRISAWTNNMVKLGKINEDQGQRIQKNLGLSKDADNMLDFGTGKNKPNNKRVKARLMELLSAKEEYSADTNRKEVFSQKIKDINGEIAYLLENKTLAPDNQRAKIEAIFSPGVEVGDVRAGLSQYVIDGKSYSKQDFLKKLGKMSASQLLKFNGKVANDEEVANQLKNKIDAVQKPETESVDARQQTEDSQGVGTGVPIQETTELETTETEQVASPIQDNLQENETVVQTEEDAKGRVFTTTKQESVRERDGMKVTKFKFNRSDKATDQRNDSFVSEEVALADTNYEINPEDRLDLQEGETATYEINEIREGDTGVGASVKFTTIDADGNKIGSFQGDVTLVEKPEINTEKQRNIANTNEKTNGKPTTETQEVEVPQVVGTNPLSSIEVSEDYNDIGAQRREKMKAVTRAMEDGEITEQEALDLRQESFDNVKEAQRLYEIRKQKRNIAKTNEKTNGKPTTEVAAGNRLFSEPLQAATEIEARVKERTGIDTPKGKRITKLNEERSNRISEAYEKQESNPNDPEVQAAYKALIDETIAQHEEILADGYVVELSDTEYKNSSDMISDLRDNKNMRVFSTEEGFGAEGITDADRAANPMLAPTKFKDKNGKPLLVNDVFRFVHDFFGHSKEGNSFGPIGEENAWDVHSRMYSPLARRAMTTETRGQNSWVNFSGVNEKAFALRDEARALRKEGKFEEAEAKVKEAYDTMKFAQQKVMLLPEEFSLLPEETPEGIALSEEVADLESTLDDTDSKVDFKLKEETTEEGFADTKEIVEAMSKVEEGAIIEGPTKIKETSPTAPKVDIEELNSRTDKPLPVVDYEVIDGIPTMFSISDQLTTGNTVNPYTGNVITNLKGGFGFNGINGHENLAWASIDNNTVKGQISTALRIYNNNKELYKNWWAANPEYNGLVPMSIVKMESNSILSNEAVVRVMADNIASFPKDKRVKALEVFRQVLETRRGKLDQAVKTGVGLSGKPVKEGTIKQYKEELEAIKDVQKMDKQIKAKTIDTLLTSKALVKLKAITSVNVITGNLGYGTTNSPNRNPVKPGTYAKNPVAKALLGDNAPLEERSKLHLGAITDVITEPQLRKTPARSVFLITGIDVLNPGIERTVHPNYPVGPRGKIIGVIEQPKSMLELFPSAYNNAVLGKAKEDAGLNRKRSDKLRLSETIPVGMGLVNKEYQGTIVGVNEEGRFLDFINRSFPFVNISTDQQTMNQLLESPDVTAYLKGDTVVYGMTKDGNIFINEDVHDSKSELYNTAIHEMGHVWVKHLSLTPKGKKIYKRGAELVQQTELYKRLLKRFDGDVDKATEEAMATLIGNRGESVVDASLQQKIKDWITAVWEYVREQFKLSKDLTTKEIQELTMDEFLGTALADIFSGKPVSLSEAQLKTFSSELKEAMFKSDQSIGSIIETGRKNGFSDASIKEVLKGRGFKVADINAAMEVKVDAFTPLPEAFGRVEGGISQGMQLFNEVRQKLSKFTTPEKTLSEVRQKAMDLIKENPIYKAQPEQTQMEILVDFDKTLNTRSNVAVQKEIAAIKNNLRQRKINSQNLKAAQIQLRNYIRKALPKSKMYTQAQINKLISRVTKSTVDTFQADTEYVMKIVDQQKTKMKKAAIKDMLKLVKAKAMTAFTKSGKRRAKGLSREGTAYFKAVKQILTADVDTLNKIQEDLQNESSEISNLIEKQQDGQKLTQKEQAKVNQALAFDTFGDVSNMSLEEVQDLMQQLKDVRAESIATFKSRRLARVEANKKMKEEAEAQIKDTNPMLFDADGNVLNKNERNARKNEILSHFRNFEIGKAFSELGERMAFSTAKEFIQGMKQMFQHLGTLTNVLDRVTQGKNFFTKNVYDALNRMDDLNNGGVFQTQGKLDAIANTIPGITKGVKEIYRKLNSGVHVLKLKRSDTGREYTDMFNADELMRIYALSLNDTQRQKLEAQGITPEVIENIKSIIGPEAVEFADKTVNFLSNEYYESVNDVYSYVNDVNLGYVNNYFPTSTIQKETTKKMITEGDFSGVFNAESAPAFKERVDMRSDVDLHSGGFTNVLKNHVDTMEKYKAYAVGTQRLNALFKIDSVNVLLEEMGVVGPIKNAINFAINPESGKDASLNPSLISRLQTKFTGFALAFKAIQILKQATSFVNAYSDYSYFPADSRVPRVVQAAVDLPMFMFDGARVVLSLAKDLVGKNGAIREAMEISPTFRKRVEQGLEGDVVGLESGRQTFKKKALTGGKLKRAQAAFKTAGASPTIIGDVLGVMGYMINYKRNIANGMSKADAVKAFNDYNATQQSRRGTDKIPIQRNNNVFVRGFTMFGSTLFLQMNKVMQSTTNITRDISQKKRPRSKDTRDLALNLAVANVLFATAANIAKFIKGDDEDRETAMKSIAEAMMGLNLIYQIPYLGSTVKDLDIAGQVIAGVKGEEYKRGRIYKSDVVNPFASVLQKYKKLTKEDENKVGAIVRTLIEIKIGAQIDPFVGLYNYFGGEEEDVDPAMYDVMGISPSYRPKNEGGKTKSMSKKDMKKFAPGLYEELYGPGGSLAPLEQLKKDERKRKRDLQKEIDAAMGLD
jgi:hypothetical protein